MAKSSGDSWSGALDPSLNRRDGFGFDISKAIIL